MRKKISLVILTLLLCSCLFSSGTKEKVSLQSTTLFKDSLSREVLIPEEIYSIAPSGNVAQMALYAIAPESLAGWSSKLNTEAKSQFLSQVKDKPVFGTFYGKKANLNLEALMSSGAQLVLDVGQIKGEKEVMIAELDDLMEKIAMPVLFLSGELDDYPILFESLGKLTGKEEKADALRQYAEQALEYASWLNDNHNKSVSVYYSPSDDRLEAVERGSSHSELLELVGAVNVVPETFSEANGQISLESLYSLDPDVILLSSKEAYEMVRQSDAWAPLRAVKENRVYLIPSSPYPLIDRPTSTQRLLGIYYLGRVLFDESPMLIEKTKEFYSLFYHIELKDTDIPKLLNIT